MFISNNLKFSNNPVFCEPIANVGHHLERELIKKLDERISQNPADYASYMARINLKMQAEDFSRIDDITFLMDAMDAGAFVWEAEREKYRPLVESLFDDISGYHPLVVSTAKSVLMDVDRIEELDLDYLRAMRLGGAFSKGVAYGWGVLENALPLLDKAIADHPNEAAFYVLRLGLAWRVDPNLVLSDVNTLIGMMERKEISKSYQISDARSAIESLNIGNVDNPILDLYVFLNQLGGGSVSYKELLDAREGFARR